MALADYRLCDVCGGKAFYDANLNYDDGPSKYRTVDKPFRLAGAEQYDNPELNHKHGMRLDYVGDWAVICDDCAKTHECKIVPRQSTPSPSLAVRNVAEPPNGITADMERELFGDGESGAGEG